MAYTPPVGNQVGLDVTGAYTPPAGNSVALSLVDDGSFVTDVSVGESSAFGTATIGDGMRELAPVGWGSIAFGSHLVSVYNLPTLYIPPAGNQVGLNIQNAYTPPTGQNVALEIGQLGAAEITHVSLSDQLEVGAHGISLQHRELLLAGWESSVFGTHLVVTDQPLYPAGWASSAYGTAAVVNYTPEILVPGIAPAPQTGPHANRQLPSPFVAFRIRYLSPTGIPTSSPQIPAVHDVGHFTRFIDLAGRGPHTWSPGTARIAYAVRYIEPPFISSMIFGAHNVARVIEVYPDGWESSDVPPGHQLDINLQRLLHHSGAADPAEYGATHIRNQFEVLSPQGWLSTEINFPIVYNQDQYLFVQPYMDTNSDPTQWPIYYPFVENVDRVLGTGGWQSSRFSIIGNIIRNNAEPILPSGFDATLWGAETFIAHRIRYVEPSGWDSFYTTQWAVVYNSARVVAPQGVAPTTVVGRPDPVLNLNRTLKQFFPYHGEAFGTAFIADAVRYVYPNVFYDTPSGFPEVRFNPYPIAPPSINPPQFGAATVYEFFNIVYPRSTNVFSVPRVGEPIVENRNKTLAVFPSYQALYGLARVFNYIAYLGASGSDTSVFGAHVIRDRTSHIRPAPISVPVFSVTHRIRNDIPDPPALQRVEPPSVIIGAFDNPGIVPAPVVRNSTIFPIGFGGVVYGQPTLTRNGIEIVRGIFSPDQVGIPLLSATQYMYPKSLPWPTPLTDPSGSSDQNWVWANRPRVSPHTIYAPSADQATAQAKANHPVVFAHRLDSALANAGISHDGGWPFFGLPIVTNYNREIGPHHFLPSSRYGNPTFTLGRQFVYPFPTRSSRFGLPRFLGVLQYLNLDTANNGITPFNAFGTHIVGFPPYTGPGLVYPTGYDATLWGAHTVELFDREITPQGIPHRGNPQQGLTNPWGLPLIGFPRVYFWGGYDFTLWGDTWVSHKIRELPVQGWNSLTLETDDITAFADRMRVRRRNPEGGIAGIGPTSVVAGPEVTHFLRTIMGRGILGYNSGDHVVNGVAEIAPIGWDSLEVGNIDEWEAGKIKPYGDDLSVMGTPRMGRVVYPAQIWYNDIDEEARVSFGISPVGIHDPWIVKPVFTDPFGCNNRAIAVSPIPPQTVPEPVVTE